MLLAIYLTHNHSPLEISLTMVIWHRRKYNRLWTETITGSITDTPITIQDTFRIHKLDILFNILKAYDFRELIIQQNIQLIEFIVLNRGKTSEHFFNYIDFDGNSFLHTAAETGNLFILKLLFQCNIDPTIKNNAGLTVSELPNLTAEIRNFLQSPKTTNTETLQAPPEKEINPVKKRENYRLTENRQLKQESDQAAMAKMLSVLIQVSSKPPCADNQKTVLENLTQLSLLLCKGPHQTPDNNDSSRNHTFS